MNILFICSAKVWGGNEKWSSMAISGLSKNHKVYFLGKNPELYEKFGSKDGSYCAPFTWNFDFKTKRIIEQIVKEKSIDLIISTKKKEYFLGGLVAKKYGIKHIIRLGIVRKMKMPFWSRLVYQKLNDGIIVNAQRIKNQLLEYPFFQKHPILVVYNGVPSLNQLPVSEKNASVFQVVSTGMLTNRKGFHILIDAIAMLPESIRKKVKLSIVGEGREEEKLKEQVSALSLQNEVEFKGFSNQPTDFLADAHLFALISGNEGISNAIIEAMYMGVPVLTTNAGGASEIISDGINGFLTDREANNVAFKLEELIRLESNTLKNIGIQGKTDAEQMFNLDRMNAEIENFISDLL